MYKLGEVLNANNDKKAVRTAYVNLMDVGSLYTGLRLEVRLQT